MTTPLQNLHPWQREHVRKEVRGLLEQSDAFRQLPDTARRDLARGMVDVVAFLADPAAGQAPGAAGTTTTTTTGGPPPSGALPGMTTPAAKSGGRSGGKGFGDALRAGAEAYRDLVDAVDFPKFVAGLIDGVFKSIVDASIRQMDAYMKLLESVVKSVDQFAKENFTLNQGRDYLVNRFPQQLEIKIEGDTPRLSPTAAGEETGLKEVKAALGLGDGDEMDLSSEDSEAELARRAQLELAKLRQKQLSTMVLLGINRIVVTDGLINAKVVVDVKANDRSTKNKSASSYDDMVENKQGHSGGGWFSSNFDDTQSTHQTIVKSASDETSESKAEAKAKLTGEVRVNFKSETFPLDKMASQTQLDSLNDRSRPT